MSPKNVSHARKITPAKKVKETPHIRACKVNPRLRDLKATPEERAEALAWLKRYGAIFDKDETRIIGVRPM